MSSNLRDSGHKLCIISECCGLNLLCSAGSKLGTMNVISLLGVGGGGGGGWVGRTI